MFRQSVLELKEAHPSWAGLWVDSKVAATSSTSHGPLTGKPSGTAVEAAR